jgi:DNA-binding FrmR family transcriptional regulator
VERKEESKLKAALGAATTSPQPAQPSSTLDAATRERGRKRLRRIEGQLRGLQAMLEKGRPCSDVLTQIASVHEALRGVARELMRSHLQHSSMRALRSSTSEARSIFDELSQLMHKYSR